jgi:hypothetical protein
LRGKNKAKEMSGRIKEAWKKQRVQKPAQSYCLGRSPVEEDLSKELEPLADYKLGVDIGGQSGRETLLCGKILPEWSQTSLGEARGDKW